MRSTGLSEVIGSWNTIAISAPRISRSSSSDSAVISRPRKRIEPATMRAGSSSRFMIDLAATLLPEPDSPTMPSVSPRCSVKLTPSTARTTPASVKNQVRRSLTRSKRFVPALPVAGLRMVQRRRACGSSQSRRPSPTKLKPITTVRIAKPGKRRHPPLRHQFAALPTPSSPIPASAAPRQARGTTGRRTPGWRCRDQA